LVLLVAEVMASIWFGKMVGGWMLLLWFVMAILVGRQIMKGASKELAPQLIQAQQGQAIDPSANFLAAVCQGLAGVLFIVPGVLSDGSGMLPLLAKCRLPRLH
jgi:UPF0716 protein FxsA